MMKILLPVLLAVIGLGGGLAGGFMLKPPPPPPEDAEMAAEGGEKADKKADKMAKAEGDMAYEAEKKKPKKKKSNMPKGEDGEPAPVDYVKLDSQFVVPVIKNEEVSALMVLSMAIEVAPGLQDLVFEREPRLRDNLLQVLFRHSESGAFAGAFTSPSLMDDLRESLLYAAQDVLGEQAYAVLVTNIIRQDM